MIKKILAILTIASLFGIGAAAADTTTEIVLQKNSVAKVIPAKATPEAQGLYVNNPEWPTVYLKLDTACRNGEHIKYNIRIRPPNTPGDGEIIDTIWADGYFDLVDSMNKYARSNKINLFWSYDNFGQESGKFEKSCR